MRDANLILSDAQAVTVTAASTNVIKLDAKMDKAYGKETPVELKVGTAFAGCTSVQVAIQTATDAAFTTPVVLVQSAAIPVASLVSGYQFNPQVLPKGNLGYIRGYYTVVGTATAGTINAALVDHTQHSYHNV